MGWDASCGQLPVCVLDLTRALLLIFSKTCTNLLCSCPRPSTLHWTWNMPFQLLWKIKCMEYFDVQRSSLDRKTPFGFDLTQLPYFARRSEKIYWTRSATTFTIFVCCLFRRPEDQEPSKGSARRLLLWDNCRQRSMLPYFGAAPFRQDDN